ncbi:MAG TPA: peptidylprolyl isomerase [Gaiellaceae bacterium]|nr:peptidylprolyl isomerase [Gaiellaceae bacterium]
MKHRTLLAGLALVVLLLAAACGGGGTATLGSADIAVVGGQQVKKDQFDALLTRTKKSYQVAKKPFPKPGTSAYNTLQGQAVTFLLQRAEFAQKAADMGIHISDKQIDDRIEQVKKQFFNGSEKRYEEGLKQQALTPDQAREEVKTQLISEALYKKVTDKVHVSDSAVENYYKANKSIYEQKESRDVRHILVPTRTLADQVYAQLVADHEKNFAALAKKYSKDPGTAASGGKLTITRGQMVPAFDKTAFALKTGQLSKPVHSSFGWHVIQALSPIKPPSVTPLDKVKASIRQQLEQQQKNEAMTTWVDDVKKHFCKPGQIKYAPGYQPNPDPCLAVTSASSTTATK